jgi:type II secretory pathway pseudopilin PulG
MTKRKAFTLIELLAAMFTMALSFSILVPMVSSTNRVWTKGSAEAATKDLLSQAALKLSPTLRNALRVDVASSTPSKLVVVLPKIDPTTGTYAMPLQDGDVIAYYLSDKSGSPSMKGTILWKATNGVPDPSWSLRSGRGAIDFGTNAFFFNFDSPTDPGLITLTACSTAWGGSKAVTGTVSTTICLRNHVISGL